MAVGLQTARPAYYYYSLYVINKWPVSSFFFDCDSDSGQKTTQG